VIGWTVSEITIEEDGQINNLMVGFIKGTITLPFVRMSVTDEEITATSESYAAHSFNYTCNHIVFIEFLTFLINIKLHVVDIILSLKTH